MSRGAGITTDVCDTSGGSCAARAQLECDVKETFYHCTSVVRGAISVRDRSHSRAAPFEWARGSLSSEPKEASRAARGTARKARPNAGCLAISRVSNDIVLVCLSGMSQEREVSGAGCLAILCQQEDRNWCLCQQVCLHVRISNCGGARAAQTSR